VIGKLMPDWPLAATVARSGTGALARAVSRNQSTVLAIGFVVALAWLSLVAWRMSPYDVALSHARLSPAYDVGAYTWRSIAFVVGWVLMTCAMMLPTTVPLVHAFRAVTRHRAALSLALLLGYVGTWLVFGVTAYLADIIVHFGVEHSPMMQQHIGLLTAAPLIVGGIYQFTPFKTACLRKCRSPNSFIIQHWRGGCLRMQALRIGAHHGLYWVGCCWGLMVIMFAVGMGNVAWMLMLAAAMTCEKTLPRGRLLTGPLGAGLIIAGIGVIALGGNL